jgi:hypothetical protein
MLFVGSATLEARAEGVGFEPTERGLARSTVFKTAAIDQTLPPLRGYNGSAKKRGRFVI